MSPHPTPNNTLVDVDGWLRALQARGTVRSDHTVRAYRGDLRRWSAAFGRDDGQVAVADIEQHLQHTLDTGLSRYDPSTRARMVGTMSSLCTWLTETGLLADDPSKRPGFRVTRRKTARLPVHFDDDQLRRIARSCAIPPERASSRWPALDRALFATLVGTGARASELCGAVVDDLAGKGTGRDRTGLLLLRGKGGKERRVPVAHDTMKLAESYLDTRDRRSRHNPEWATTPTSALFLDHKAQPLTPSKLNHRIVSWLEQADVAKPHGATAHAFRHTYGYRLAANGVALPVIQRLMGHGDIETTMVYLRMTARDDVEAVTRLNLGDIFPS